MTVLRFAAVFIAGVLFGVSFIATPAKFLAESVSRADLLLVGRATFSTFALFEFAAAGMLVALSVVHRRGRIPACALTAIILGQHLILRPILDHRVSAIVSGDTVDSSIGHSIYIVLELAKLGLLAVLVILAGVRSPSARTP